MNPDQKYDEAREQEYIDEVCAREAAELATYFEQQGIEVLPATYPSTHIMGIDLTFAELAKHPALTPQRVADIVTEHTGNTWQVSDVKPNYKIEAGDHGYPKLPFEGLRVMLTRPV